MSSVQTCGVCKGTTFDIIDGNYFCMKCLTQNDNIQEHVQETRVDSSTRVRSLGKISTKKSQKPVQIDGWTSWELYNFILHGITNEAIELGASPEVKLTVLQLWATYLGKIEAAFTSTTKKCIPKLAQKYYKRDAEILYGRIMQRKKRKKRRTSTTSTSSVLSSFQSTKSISSRTSKKKIEKLLAEEFEKPNSADDSLSSFSASQSLVSLESSFSQASSTKSKIKFNKAARQEAKKVKEKAKKIPYSKKGKYKKEHVTTQYKLGPQVITPMKLWVILYLALRIHDQNIHLSDMLRYGREGHLSYYKLDHLLPSEVSITKKDMKILSQSNELTHKGFRRVAAGVAKFLGVELNQPNFLPIVEQYCQELQLPRGILLYTERMMALSPPKMIFNEKSSYTPNYEGRAMAFIVVAMKMLFSLDGITEYEISRVTEKLNSVLNVLGLKNVKMIPGCITPSIIVHGGVGKTGHSVMIEKMVTCQKAASVGYKILMKGGKASDAAEAALLWFEDDEFFNCGYGSVLNEIGEVEMDASMMDGNEFKIGSVAAVSDIEHPISLAKYVMENYPNTIIAGEGARKLAKCAGLNLVSKGNMVAPISYWAYKIADAEDLQAENFNFDNPHVAEMLKNSSDTVGCVVWDGYSIVAAASSGGLNKKLVGRVGDSSLLGCGVFANNHLGCCLSGHGESIIKLGLSRAIANTVLEGHTLADALQRNLDNMYKQTGYDSAGVALEKCGCWSACVSGAPDIKEANEKGVFLSQLFSFCEWQRFIECRRTVLTDVHFPTKLRYDPESPGNTHLYLRFLGLLQSKREGEQQPRVTDYKHSLPELLNIGFRTCFETLNEKIMPVKEIEIFPPSLTPQKSYIEHILKDPLNDLPDILKRNFFETKVGYTTKPELLQELAMQCGIKLNVINTNLHFIEKKVSEFEQPKMPSIQSLNEIVIVNDPGINTDISPKSENLFDYVHRKAESRITINITKNKYYDNVKTNVINKSESAFSHEFFFDQVRENGKLLIANDNDSENENVSRVDFSPFDKNSLLRKDFCDRYNLSLSKHEQQAVLRPDEVLSKRRQIQKTFCRNAQGKFVSKSEQKSNNKANENIEAHCISETKEENLESDVKSISEASSISEDDNFNNAVPLHSENLFDLHDSDISVLEDFNESRRSRTLEYLQLFRPFKDYWMYNCIFSRVKPKNFELFEKQLPVNFRWLLRECADTTEMSTEDLYEEICLIEAYFSHILKPKDTKVKSKNPIAKSYHNTILNKW